MALLDVDDLGVSFVTRNGVNKAVDGVGFTVEAGKITAIIGESGSGKSVACYSLLGLVPTPPGRIDSGTALFEGSDLLQLPEDQLRRIRGRDIAMVFQDPMTCLNPYMTVGKQLMEPLLLHGNASRRDARARAIQLMEEVGIREPAVTIDHYPHQFSGGMRQRIMIAMALINEPKLLIADEPTTALDVTIQAQILALLANLQKKRDVGIVFISHDLAVVSDIADSIVVMQEGRVVERGGRDDIFLRAQHPYTQKLLAAIPSSNNAGNESGSEPLLQVNDLTVRFRQRGGEPVTAVDRVSFEVRRGEILGLVGESGSGKSTIGRAVLQLQAADSGSVRFDGVDLGSLSKSRLKAMRRRMQIIFQDPFASLNPRMTVFDTLAEPLLLHGLATRKTVTPQVLALMDDVGLARSQVRKYPHEFSGGQRQRIAIGRALATRPEFVVADEPVSALDVTIQAQILDLIGELGREYGLTLLFISHDLAVVRQLSDRIMVLHQGRLVEEAVTGELFDQPREDYTQRLLAAVPGRSLSPR
jgi:peptide/nickel transport system ATP-binding protein/oligopeptide transport system ATP-binding protein